MVICLSCQTVQFVLKSMVLSFVSLPVHPPSYTLFIWIQGLGEDLNLDGKCYFVVWRQSHLGTLLHPSREQDWTRCFTRSLSVDWPHCLLQATPGFSWCQGAPHSQRPGHGVCQPRLRKARKTTWHTSINFSNTPASKQWRSRMTSWLSKTVYKTSSPCI